MGLTNAKESGSPLVLPPALGVMLLILRGSPVDDTISSLPICRTLSALGSILRYILPTLGRVRVLVGDDGRGMLTPVIHQLLRTSWHYHQND